MSWSLWREKVVHVGLVRVTDESVRVAFWCDGPGLPTAKAHQETERKGITGNRNLGMFPGPWDMVRAFSKKRDLLRPVRCFRPEIVHRSRSISPPKSSAFEQAHTLGWVLASVALLWTRGSLQDVPRASPST